MDKDVKEGIVNGVRKYYNIPENITDEFIKKKLSHTLGADLVRVSIALFILKKELLDFFVNTVLKYFRR